MGNYKAAVDAAEEMISLRPDIRSYSRIGYLREIHGDLDGAIEAMLRAVKAGGAGDEPTSWARVQLGRLYENAGNLQHAEMHYTITLDQRPLYPYALAGMARVAMAKKEVDKAIQLLQQADTLVNDPAFKEELAQLYLNTGQPEKAQSLLNSVVNEVKANVAKTKDNESEAHHADDQLANAYLMLGDYEQALKHALNEYSRRPENIEMNELVAWIYHKKGESQKAVPHAAVALKTGCTIPRLTARMGILYAKAGDKAKAKQLLQQSLQRKPHFADQQLQQEAEALLQNL
jgi:tetratricopeptide (TPR) repeat protein